MKTALGCSVKNTHNFFPVKIILEESELITCRKKGQFLSLGEIYLNVGRIEMSKHLVCVHSYQDHPGGLLTSAHSQLCYMDSGL